MKQNDNQKDSMIKPRIHNGVDVGEIYKPTITVTPRTSRIPDWDSNEQGNQTYEFDVSVEDTLSLSQLYKGTLRLENLNDSNPSRRDSIQFPTQNRKSDFPHSVHPMLRHSEMDTTRERNPELKHPYALKNNPEKNYKIPERELKNPRPFKHDKIKKPSRNREEFIENPSIFPEGISAYMNLMSSRYAPKTKEYDPIVVDLISDLIKKANTESIQKANKTPSQTSIDSLPIMQKVVQTVVEAMSSTVYNDAKSFTIYAEQTGYDFFKGPQYRIKVEVAPKNKL
ncbi:MAG: hypothetical protein WC755_05635 [Candidatus Woesearchaeota archaeon]|jgi:hypothetical protein